MEQAPIVLGRYAIFDKIGAGGTATVHIGRLAGAAGFSRTVAIKRLHPHLADEPEFISMMIDEARLAARVNHPNVVQTLDIASVDRELLLVMEYVRGESLGRLLRLESARNRRIPLSIVSAVVSGALYGLHAAHEAKSDRGVPLGMVHRDMSPQNILVGVDGVARMIDFGVAKAVGRLQTTRDGDVKGKLAYMAPEQLSGKATTRAADIYAAAVVLWEALTGRRLFQATDDGELMGKVLAGPASAPSGYASEVPQAADIVTMRGLAREPTDRFGTAFAMAEALVRAIPPALPTEVGAWVEEVAHEGLARRAAQLDAIETYSSIDAPVAVPEPMAVKSDGVPATAVSPPAPAGRPSRWSPVRTLSVLGAVAIVGVAIAVLRAPVAGASRTDLTSDSLPPAPAALVSATPPSPPDPATAAPPAGTSAPQATNPKVSATTPARTQGRPSPRKPNCNPPYTLDAIGVRVPKPGCY